MRIILRFQSIVMKIISGLAQSVIYVTCFHCWTTSNKSDYFYCQHTWTLYFFFKVWTSQISLFSGNQMILSTIMGTECVPSQLSHPMCSKLYLIQLQFFFFCTQITNSNSDIATIVLTLIFIFSFKYIIYNLINLNCLLCNSDKIINFVSSMLLLLLLSRFSRVRLCATP